MANEDTQEHLDPMMIQQQLESICAKDEDLSNFRNWFQSGNNVPKDFEFSYNALKKLVGFPFPQSMLLEFDGYLIQLAKWAPETRFQHFYKWFYRPIINGQYDGMPEVMESVRKKLNQRPLWKKLIGFYP